MNNPLRFFALASLLFLCASAANALPMFGMRSGRTCGNCHISPTYEDKDGWDNPELSKRKCNLSCVACHVNPTGGGLRNASGRYYGDSTLSMFTTTERSYSDYKRDWLKPGLLSQKLRELGLEIRKTAPPNTIPSDYEDVVQGKGRLDSWNRPFWGQDGERAYWDGRYGGHVADPLLNVGADFRGAFWSGSKSLFPMQAEVGAALHPVRYVTAMATVAVQGRTGGLDEILEDQSPVFARNAFVMAHQLPYMAYAKAGIFQPAFGTHIDDHTSPIRSDFEMNVATPEDTVQGVEIGAFPNYPFAVVSAFRNGDVENPGYGASVQAGWRDLGWSVTASGMSKIRPEESARGSLHAGALSWGLNPAYYLESLPITYTGELAVGLREEELNWAMYHEAWWLIKNGLNLRVKVDGSQQALDDPVKWRTSAGIDVSPYPGVTMLVQGRQFLEDKRNGFDLFAQLHLWF